LIQRKVVVTETAFARSHKYMCIDFWDKTSA